MVTTNGNGGFNHMNYEYLSQLTVAEMVEQFEKCKNETNCRNCPVYKHSLCTGKEDVILTQDLVHDLLMEQREQMG